MPNDNTFEMKVSRHTLLLLICIIFSSIPMTLAKKTKSKSNRKLNLGDGEYINEEMLEQEKLDHSQKEDVNPEAHDLDNRNQPNMQLGNEDGKEENEYLSKLMDNLGNHQLNKNER